MRLPDDSQACIRSALRRRRRTLGLTQNDAANLLGMSRVSYHRIETGVRRIRFLEIAAICEAFNCHVGELVQDGQLASAYVHAAKAILGEAACSRSATDDGDRGRSGCSFVPSRDPPSQGLPG